jgi:hypothetical protein
MGRRVWLFGGIFGGVGVAMLAVASALLLSTIAFRSGAQRVPGRVVGLDSGKPVVEFSSPDGATHRIVGSVSSSPPAYEIEEGVTVLHPPGRPAEARIDGLLESWFLPSLFGGLGTLFAGIGGAFGIAELRRRRLRAWLEQFGTRVEAKYTGVMRDTSTSLNRRHPWRLTAQWQDPVTGLVHSFESDMLFWDPSDHVKRETIAVWIDPNDPRRHHLDTTFLPKHAGS